MKRMMANPAKADKMKIYPEENEDYSANNITALAIIGYSKVSDEDKRRRIPFYKSNKRRNKENIRMIF
jgi:hypothetical protein